jgi:hypothetical protein
MTCPHCQGSARFKGYRQKGRLSVLGPLTVNGPITTAPTATKATALAMTPSAWTKAT